MKRIGIVLCILFSAQWSFACDICGCSSGAYFIGPSLHFQKHFMSARYSFRTYFSRMADDPGEFSRDLYQTAEFVGGLTLGRRWQLLGFVPYNINRQEMEHHPHREQGLGDITLVSQYRWLDRKNKRLSAGAGLKLPTGNFDPGLAHHPVPSANVQPGTGSVDLLLNVNGVWQWANWSFHSNLSCKINGSRKEFRFGNRLDASALLSRQLGRRSNWTPYAGLQLEQLNRNRYQRVRMEDTGGRALLGTAGMDIRVGKINWGMNVELPVAQNFSNQQTDARVRGMVQLSYVF